MAEQWKWPVRRRKGWTGEGEGSVDGDFGGGVESQGWLSNGDEGGGGRWLGSTVGGKGLGCMTGRLVEET